MLAAAVDPALRHRLARLLGMLGSEYDSEALNAARLADRLVRSSGLSWSEVLSLPAPDPRSDDDAFADWPGGWRGACAFVLRQGTLNEFERTFCTKITGYVGEASPKQQAVLRRLLDRAVAEGRRETG